MYSLELERPITQERVHGLAERFTALAFSVVLVRRFLCLSGGSRCHLAADHTAGQRTQDTDEGWPHVVHRTSTGEEATIDLRIPIDTSSVLVSRPPPIPGVRVATRIMIEKMRRLRRRCTHRSPVRVGWGRRYRSAVRWTFSSRPTGS